MKKLLLLFIVAGSWCISNAQTSFSPWGIEFYYTPQLAQYLHITKKNAPSIRSERPSNRTYAFSTGVQLRRQFKPKWSLSFGLDWHSASEPIELVRWQTQEVNSSLNKFLSSANNLDELEVNYFFVEIPLSIRYHLEGDRFRIYFRSGLQPSLFLTSHFVTRYGNENIDEGQNLDGNGLLEGGFVLRSASPPPRRLVNVAALLGCGLEWRLNQRLGLFVEPEARIALFSRNISHILINLNGLGAHRYLLGTRLGMTLQFGRS